MEETISLLRQLRERLDSGYMFNGGICRYVITHRKSYHANMDTLKCLFEAWPGFSGDAEYPIPCPNGGSPVLAFDYTKFEHFYDRKHPYGKLRMAFLDWAIDVYAI